MELRLLFILSLFVIPKMSLADQVTVEASKDYPAEKFPSDKYKIKKNKPSDVLPPEERDLLLSQAGLTDDTSHMDHLDKDVLVLRAKNLDLKALEKQYPKIPSAKLKDLKQKVQKK